MLGNYTEDIALFRTLQHGVMVLRVLLHYNVRHAKALTASVAFFPTLIISLCRGATAS